jgi:hypothetical protein
MALGEVQPTFGDHKELETLIGKKLALVTDLMSYLTKTTQDMDGQ